MRELTVDVGGPIVFDDYGGSGDPMVLLHGIGGSKLNWGQLAPLLTAGYHVYALDAPGFGSSPLAGRRTGPRRNAPVVADFVALVAGRPAVVVGHSMGGLTTMILAGAHPEAVRAAVLLDPAYPAPSGEVGRSPAEGTPRWLLNLLSRAPRASSAIATLTVRSQDLDRVVRGTIVKASGPRAEIPEAVIQAHVDQERARIRAGNPYQGYLDAWRDIDDLFGRTAEIESVAASVVAPTLLLHGDADPVVPPAAAARLHELRPDWSFQWLDGVGHQPLFETPALVAATMRDWLATLDVVPTIGRG